MKDKKYTRLTLKERFLIERMLRAYYSITEISQHLERPRSTIHREIQRTKDIPGKWYNAEQAQFLADFKGRLKRIESKLLSNSLLRFYVLKSLKKEWSPEQIANRIKLDYPDNEEMRISYESIYKYIYIEAKGMYQKRLISLLPYSKPKRWAGNRRHIYMGKILERVPIDERPQEINLRNVPGHWEGDLIVGKEQKSAIGTLVERQTRYTIIVPLKSRKSKHVVNQFADEILKMPQLFLQSLTYDNGIEMSEHKHFTYRTKMPVYFTHPYSSWERGTNENTNGLIRRFFPKKTDFTKVSSKQLKLVQNNLNNRPRKVLGYKTPFEKLTELCA